MIRFRIAVGAALFLVAPLTLPGCARRESNGAIRAAGHVEAIDLRLSAKIGGRILRYDPVEGDLLTAGQTLAQIDTVDLVLSAARLRADRDKARADYDLLRAGARREDVEAARAAHDKAKADLDWAQRSYERTSSLFATGAVSKQIVDDAETKRNTARADEAQAAEMQRKMEAGARPEEIASARAKIASAEAEIASIERQIHDCTILVPRNGVLTEKLAEAGESVSPNVAVAVMVDLETAWLNVYIPEPDLGKIRLGQEAKVTTDDGQVRPGRVTFIASQAEFTPKNVQTRDERVKLVYKLKISLDNKDGLFKPGMPAEALLTPAEKTAGTASR